ncbi:tRNA 2-selenouridine synthase [Chromobacterium sp. LK11]|uniref:tRNA 2-selenouridine(34) synthase MnmH n=1 Tax=Chromobacterium sp. LK11 TaxID=1628212 RepID=UPI000653B877|nr:tRNA 2-selenouridine(34) synthase MnmH [Chromobacterium sp. LK11]KMN81992.1 tRNA 2-selenouridine synthase [Chromobacterium sp. LK11]
MLFKVANVSQLGQFDEIIDVRSPAEFAEDHIPGAINCPVLDNDERIRVGTLYKQVSPFEARKVGAALAAKNIARHIEESFSDRPKSWRPLICCWRGGQRSGSMALIFAQIGWPAHQLEGGYKAYRRQALQWLEELPGRLRLRVICGPTGSGKSRLLQALARAGHQVLDLEQLANHRGSVLGRLPDQPQPPQKWFDTLLLQQIRALDPNRPVFIEAESKKVGFVSLPDALYRQMHQGDCLLIDVPLAERVRFLLEDYAFYLQDPEALIRQLGFLKGLHSGEQLDAWNQMIRAGRFDALVAELLAKHYDPLYYRSLGTHYPQLAEAMPLRLDSLAPERLDLAAAQIA